MRRGRFAVLLVLSMALAGCLGPSTASWGTDNSEIDVQFSQESTNITSGLGPESSTITDLKAIGCASEWKTLGVNNSAPLSFTGYLAASQYHSAHSESTGASGLDFGVTTSVAIQSLTFQEAKDVIDGEGSRISVKNWDVPLNPETGTGTVDLEEIDSDSDSEWYILGLIPTTENIHDGMISLDEWHQPVTIKGYLIQYSSGNNLGYFNTAQHKVDDNCNLQIGEGNKESVYVFVTSIELDGATVSSNGNSDDEWVYGDVAFLGRTGYILFFLAFGVGGGIGAFILSKMFVLQGAKSTMKTLLGASGMSAVKQVKKDVKSAKSSGLVSPLERKKEARQQAVKNQPQSSNKTSSEPALAGFDLDSVLSSSPSTGSTVEFGSKSSSVVVTAESQQMKREVSEQPSVTSVSTASSSAPPRETRSSVTSSEPPRQQKEHFTSSVPTSKKSSGPPKKKSVRKRKAAVQATAGEEHVQEEVLPVPQETRKTFDEPEDDFSDFSF